MASLAEWAHAIAVERAEVTAVGYFGSYARGDWGVGSDVDVVVVVSRSNKGFPRRAIDYPITGLPVPADLLAYTVDELNQLDPEGPVRSDLVWVYERPGKATERPS